MYGEPQKITYSLYAAATRMYLDPQLGVSLLVNEQSGTVIVEMRYEAMGLEEYLSRWGQDLPREDPYSK